MKIALIGYGKMGHEIEAIAGERNHDIVLTIDINNPSDLTISNLQKADVAIEFTSPDSAYNHIIKCFDAGVPVVSGSTGWLDKMKEVKERCVEENQSFFYASNFSLGVNILFAVNKYLGNIMNQFEQYEVLIDETHHTQKLDAPSGTAITLAEQLIALLGRKKAWELNEQSVPEKLRIDAHRIPDVPGTHQITYNSDVDEIQLMHRAKSRKGFALGALMAAEFIQNKKGVFSMSDLLGF